MRVGIFHSSQPATVNSQNQSLVWTPKKPAPGSQVFLVYTRAQQADTATPTKLDTGPTDEVVLIKFQYFL